MPSSLCVLWSTALVSVTLGGCTVDPLELGGRSCPCVDGWTCDSTREVCVPGDAGAASDASVHFDGEAPDATDAGRDAAPPDAGPDETACDDALSGAIVCDGFEDGAFAAWDTVVEIDGATDRVSTPVYRGTGALHGTVTAPDGQAGVGVGLDPIASGTVWLRGYWFLPSTVPIGHVSFLYFYEALDPFDGVGVGVADPGGLWLYSAPDTYLETGVTLPADRWFCVQVRIDVADAGGSVEVFVDGRSEARATDIDSLPAAGYTSLTVGLERARISPAEVFADEVALGRSELPCDGAF
jgi:hypothetical protein